MTIDPIGSRGISGLDTDRTSKGGESFAAVVTKMLRDVNSDQTTAAKKIIDLTVHGRGTIHDAMLAMSTAEGSFRLMMEMRNRLIDGFNRLLQTRG